jgi:hypothetical protein
MIDIDSVSFLGGYTVAAVSVLSAVGSNIRKRSLRRAAELKAAELALQAHLDAMDAIVDDPALPLGALEMLTDFSEGIADREFCEFFTDAVSQHVGAKDRPPRWFDDVEELRKTRPDVAANFFKAIGAGLAVAYLRWPGTSWKLTSFAAALSMDEGKEAVLAERVSELNRSRRNKNDNDMHPRVPIPA